MSKDKEWDSGLKIVQEPIIQLELDLLLICDEIQRQFPQTEFSILAKGYETEDGFYVTKDYIIPKQTVTSTYIDYDKSDPLDKYKERGYNVVIHSHHDMGTFFSATDVAYINTHFPCSVLYTSKGFTLGNLSFKKGDSIFLMEVKDIDVIANDKEVEGIENITKKTMQYTVKKTERYRQKTLYDEEDALFREVDYRTDKFPLMEDSLYYEEYDDYPLLAPDEIKALEELKKNEVSPQKK